MKKELSKKISLMLCGALFLSGVMGSSFAHANPTKSTDSSDTKKAVGFKRPHPSDSQENLGKKRARVGTYEESAGGEETTGMSTSERAAGGEKATNMNIPQRTAGEEAVGTSTSERTAGEGSKTCDLSTENKKGGSSSSGDESLRVRNPGFWSCGQWINIDTLKHRKVDILNIRDKIIRLYELLCDKNGFHRKVYIDRNTNILSVLLESIEKDSNKLELEPFRAFVEILKETLKYWEACHEHPGSLFIFDDSKLHRDIDEFINKYLNKE